MESKIFKIESIQKEKYFKTILNTYKSIKIEFLLNFIFYSFLN